jgi:phosphatidylserine/phosphatidylglycerophosphate/cardiolipin synthase-like enzyme
VSLARELVQLSRNLGLDPFIEASSSLLNESPKAKSILNTLKARFPTVDTTQLLLLVLQALEVEASEPRAQAAKVECVTTLPAAPMVPTRPTRTVIREMLAAGRRCVLIAGYMITDDDGVIHLVHQAARRGLEVTLICDSGNDDAVRIRATWPGDVASPRILINSPEGPPTGKMHAKVLLIDDNDLLVTSANFTHHGQAVNVEYGLRLSGEPARRTAAFFRAIEEQRVLVERT